MPYKRVGKIVYSKSSGKWRIKQRSKTIPSAKAALALLRGIEHGWTPTGKKAIKRKE